MGGGGLIWCVVSGQELANCDQAVGADVAQISHADLKTNVWLNCVQPLSYLHESRQKNELSLYFIWYASLSLLVHGQLILIVKPPDDAFFKDLLRRHIKEKIGGKSQMTTVISRTMFTQLSFNLHK
jgi:hypothetical protein